MKTQYAQSDTVFVKEHMDYIQQSFSVHLTYKVFFTEHLFAESNPLFRDFLNSQKADFKKKILFVIDEGVVESHPGLPGQIRHYFRGNDSYSLVEDIIVIQGGEIAKNNEQFFYNIVNAVNVYGI